MPSTPVIRPATPADLPGLLRVVRDAYTPYIERIGKPPGPMLDDYPARLREGVVWVAEHDGRLAGLTVLLPKEDHLLLDNVCVDPFFRGRGVGRQLIEFAESQARSADLPELRLYTHQMMHENIALYARTGWTETGRIRQDGYDRVLFRKPVASPA